MTESSGFSVLVRRLLAHRGLDACARDGIDEPGLRTALDGSEPTRVFPLAEAGQAQHRLETGPVTGRILLAI